MIARAVSVVAMADGGMTRAVGLVLVVGVLGTIAGMVVAGVGTGLALDWCTANDDPIQYCQENTARVLPAIGAVVGCAGLALLLLGVITAFSPDRRWRIDVATALCLAAALPVLLLLALAASLTACGFILLAPFAVGPAVLWVAALLARVGFRPASRPDAPGR